MTFIDVEILCGRMISLSDMKSMIIRSFIEHGTKVGKLYFYSAES